MNDKVVYLEFNNNKTHDEYIAFTTCAHCKNKTFKIMPSGQDGIFPMLICAACGTNIGQIGWADNKEAQR